MATKAHDEVPTGMQRICRRFERWRSSHRGRLPIPEGLWASAAAVAREHVGGGEKGYQNGGEVVPCQESRSE